MCRTSIPPIDAMPKRVACIIRIEHALVVLKDARQQKLMIPMAEYDHSQSPQCAAHQTTFMQTGFNVNVAEALNPQEADSQTLYFHCELSGNFDGTITDFPTPAWARKEVAGISLRDPFAITGYQWHPGHDLIEVRNMFVKTQAN